MISVTPNETRRPAVLAALCTQTTPRRFERSLRELSDLAKTCGFEPVCTVTQTAASPRESTYFGKGKVEELKLVLEECGADLVIFDQTLSPTQFRNLGKILSVEILDRTGLILTIFADQAQTKEARLQVEHAQLQYMMPRLTGLWTHFGRQAGSSGSRSNRGVGETQLELDRRHLERRMAVLEKELKEIAKERQTQRDARLSSPLPKVALVGYTNAGKSTLMNRLLDLCESGTEKKKVLEENKLFATLDTTVRKIEIKGRLPFLLSDTVGFIDELPHSLIKAFRSTLEEVRYADLLLQVIDYSDPDHDTCRKVTEDTLKEIGAGGIPMLLVYNKTDLVEDKSFSPPQIVGDRIYLSAGVGVGLSELLDLLEETLRMQLCECAFRIPYSRGDLLSLLTEAGDVIKTDYTEEGILLSVRCRPALRDQLSDYLIEGGRSVI